MVCVALMMGHSRILLELVVWYSVMRATPSMYVPTTDSVTPPDASAEVGAREATAYVGWKLRYTAPDTARPVASNLASPGSPGAAIASTPTFAKLE